MLDLCYKREHDNHARNIRKKILKGKRLQYCSYLIFSCCLSLTNGNTMIGMRNSLQRYPNVYFGQIICMANIKTDKLSTAIIFG
uniref:Uncharacterized protein n=1 Tax=Arundo donax TaxID=35708 RepID=A0A0A9AG55_ARUDO